MTTHTTHALPAQAPGHAAAPVAPRERRRGLKLAAVFVGVAAVVFGSIATLNYRLNPLTYDSAQQAAVAGVLVDGKNVAIADPNIDWRALRVQYFTQAKETPDVVLFGGSRWQEATGAAMPGKRFYNAFVTNDFFEDQVALVGLLYSTHHLPKTLILSVRFFSFDYLDRHDPVGWKYFSSDYREMSSKLGIPAHSWSESSAFGKYSHLLSADAAFAKMQREGSREAPWRITEELSNPDMNIIGRDGALRFSQAHLRPLTPQAVEADALQTAAEHRAARIRIDRSLLGQLGTLVRFLKSQGVQVVLVQTPVHPAYLKAIQGSPYYEDVKQIEQDTRRVAESSGALVGGGLDSVALGCTAADYRDFNHASDRCLTQVLSRIPGLH